MPEFQLQYPNSKSNAGSFNSNSNFNYGSFNSNSNSNSGMYPEYQLQLQFQLRRFQLQLQLWSWSCTKLQLKFRSWSWTQLQIRSWQHPWVRGKGNIPLQWRHNTHDDVPNHRRLCCLLKCLLRRRWKKTSKLRVTGLCEKGFTGDRWFPLKKGQ